MRYQFPKGFLWGAACSGPQTEGRGGKQADSIWEYWFRQQPERFWDGIGNSRPMDFHERYPEYFAKMREAGVRSYRTSIQWSRVISDRNGTPDPAGIQFYHDVLDCAKENGIEPMLCLHHFDMPMYWMEKGGFENRDTVQAFVEYAGLCFREYGGKVRYWSTFNEPAVIASQGYINQVHYPLVRDMKRAAQVTYHLQLASSLAVAEYHRMGIPGKIGIILNLSPSYPPENGTEADRKACQIADLLEIHAFLDPSLTGNYPEDLVNLLKEYAMLPETKPEDLESIRANRVDYLGVNYYAPRRIRARREPLPGPILPESFFETYTFAGQKINPYRGWEIYEKGVYDIACMLRDTYGNFPWYLSENGMGVEAEERFLDKNGTVQDDYRIAFIQDHLRYLHKAIAEGCACFGYHLWAAFDNWSWTNAYKNRYGLIRVDINHGCKLTLKKSAAWFRQLTAENGFSDADEKPAL